MPATARGPADPRRRSRRAAGPRRGPDRHHAMNYRCDADRCSGSAGSHVPPGRRADRLSVLGISAAARVGVLRRFASVPSVWSRCVRPGVPSRMRRRASTQGNARFWRSAAVRAIPHRVWRHTAAERAGGLCGAAASRGPTIYGTGRRVVWPAPGGAHRNAAGFEPQMPAGAEGGDLRAPPAASGGPPANGR